MSINKKRAFETLTRFSVNRISASSLELDAANFLKDECIKAGCEAFIEEFEIEDMKIEKIKFSITKPYQKEYNAVAIGRSGVTDIEGACGPLCYIENGLDVNIADVKGKICLATGRLDAKKINKLVENGALGYIAISGSLYDTDEMKRELQERVLHKKKDDKDLPAAYIHISDAEEILTKRASEATLSVVQDMQYMAKSYNVVATIDGSTKKDEIVAFSAHYDSVKYSDGAWDNATGSITILELLHHYMENKPLRTLKFVFCGSEEKGLFGSKNYCLMHKEELEKHIFNINVDMTGVQIGYDQMICSCHEAVGQACDFFAKEVGFPIETKQGIYPSDSTSFAFYGVPAVTFARLMPAGGKQIHCRRDTMDYLDEDVFYNTIEFMAKYSSKIVNAYVNPISREFPKDLKVKLDDMSTRFGWVKEDKKDKEDKEEVKDK